jgi:hypothetical protein
LSASKNRADPNFFGPEWILMPEWDQHREEAIMSRKLALGSILAFCAALGVGRLLFSGAPAEMAAAPGAIDAGNRPLIDSLMLPISSPVLSPEIQAATATSNAIRARGIDQALREVAGGVRNDNHRMSHFIPAQYVEGTTHTAQASFGETVHYQPQTQELRRNGEVIAVLGNVTPTRGQLEKSTKGTAFVYPATYMDTTERMYVRPEGGIEHDIILAKPPLALDSGKQLAYTGYLRLSPKLTLWDGNKEITGKYTTRNGISIKNAFGNAVFFLRPPIAWDANVTLPDGSFDKQKQARTEFSKCYMALEYQLDFDDSGIRLAIVTPGKWLTDPSRAYPVTIDPNLGPGGLADGNPPTYIGSPGTDTLLPASAGGTKMPIIGVATPAICGNKPNNAYGAIPMPFPFSYYGQNFGVNQNLFVHVDGFASWICPFETCPPSGIPTSACFDTDNTAIPSGGYPNNAMYAYWDDLKFGPPKSDTDPGSGIYFFVDGTAPNRRLVIEWHKMQYAASPNPTDIISFNLILYECENKIEIIIGQADEKDLGRSSVGIEDPTGTIGIQYCFNGKDNGQQPITPGTAISFQLSPLNTINVQTDRTTGCIPLDVCFNSTVVLPPVNCGTGPSIPPSFGFHWIFDNRTITTRLDATEAFTEDICHTYVVPGKYEVVLEITNEFGTKTSFPPIEIFVCDKPIVVIGASPQGGYAPLTVDFEARTPNNIDLQFIGTANWVIERLGLNNEPGQVQQIASIDGTQIRYRFDEAGTYRANVLFNATDIVTGLPTVGSGVVYIFVVDPSQPIVGDMVITDSAVKIDWIGKVDGPDPDGIPPNQGSTDPKFGLPDNPLNDTIGMRGVINLPGIKTSDLAGRRVRVVLNGVDPIFDSFLDASGHATQGDAATGRLGTFAISQPSGKFFMTSKGDLYGSLGVGNITETRPLASQYRIEIEGLFPTPNSSSSILTYDYRSRANKQAAGVYRFGAPAKGVVSGLRPDTLPIGTGNERPPSTLVSGTFLVTAAKIKLEGNSVYADLSGVMARFGGDDLQPRADSDVIVSLGGYSESLNFTTTPTFKSSGKAPSQKFSFKRSKAFGATGIASLQWSSGPGAFKLKTNALPNELVGINPALAVQALNFGLTITPENGNAFNGSTRFELNKKSPTQFIRAGK